MRALHVFRYAVLGVVAVVGAGLGYLAYTALDLGAPSVRLAPGAPLGQPFALVDHTGAPVTEALFAAQPTVVFFGFTHCPEVCPTILYEMADWSEALGADAADLNWVFVTVDPERDTPEVLRDYLAAFGGRPIGVTGPAAAVGAMIRSFGIFSARIALAGDDYTMDHTATVLLLDRRRNLIATIGYSEGGNTAIAKLRRLLETV